MVSPATGKARISTIQAILYEGLLRFETITMTAIQEKAESAMWIHCR